jgi:localization factor PodJL
MRDDLRRALKSDEPHSRPHAQRSATRPQSIVTPVVKPAETAARAGQSPGRTASASDFAAGPRASQGSRPAEPAQRPRFPSASEGDDPSESGPNLGLYIAVAILVLASLAMMGVGFFSPESVRLIGAGARPSPVIEIVPTEPKPQARQRAAAASKQALASQAPPPPRPPAAAWSGVIAPAAAPPPLAPDIAALLAKAEAGHAPSQYMLASAYERGAGAPLDKGLARSWYARAAAAGHVAAMHNLGNLYMSRGATAAEKAEARRLFRAAAEHGFPASQHNLAVMLESGSGGGKDPAEAYVWFALAAMSGDVDSEWARAKLRTRLGQDEIARAERVIAEWRPKPRDEGANAAEPRAHGKPRQAI